MDPFVAAFRELAHAAPAAPLALGSTRAWSRAEIAGHLDRALEQLDRLALAPGSVVGLACAPGPAFLWAWLALRQAGLCALLLDAGTPAEERLRSARHVGASALWQIANGWATPECASGPLPVEGSERGRLERGACLKLSSGSTGDAVGIAVGPAELLADDQQLARSLGLSELRRALVVIPLSHSYGFSVLAGPACLRGLTLVFPENEDPARVAAEFAVDFLPSVPSWYRAQSLLADRAVWPASTRLFLSAGAPLNSELARAWRLQHGRSIHAFYGASECGGITYDRSGEAAERGSVGSPIAGVELELLEENEGVGRLVVRSAGVAQGYVPSGSRSERLQPRRFVTGDLARIVDNEVYLVGRADDWINVKGKKVNPREVERVLAELPGVEEVVVIGVGLPGDRGEHVRAAIACADGCLEYRDVLEWCRPRLAPHKLPKSILFLRELPRTERGKLDRKALASTNTVREQP